MGIVFNEASLSFKLDTENTSYVIGIADEEKFIGHCYYGAKVSDEDMTYLLRTKRLRSCLLRTRGSEVRFLIFFRRVPRKRAWRLQRRSC